MTSANTYETKVYDANGGAVSTASVDVSALGGHTRKRLLRDTVIGYQANQRQGTHKTKTRAEINRTSRKPFRQKGTGRARAGDFASPLWRGGGTIFGPQPRSYRHNLNRKARREALRSALLAKFQDGEAHSMQNVGWSTPSTKSAKSALAALGALEGGACVVLADDSEVVRKSFRNLPRVDVVRAVDVNGLDVLRRRHLVLVGDALQAILARAGGAAGAGEGGADDAQ